VPRFAPIEAAGSAAGGGFSAGAFARGGSSMFGSSLELSVLGGGGGVGGYRPKED
jgi:hypothetical protein